MLMNKARVGQATLPPTKEQPEGTCFVCGRQVIARCGEKNVWHWAHKTEQACDPWWENETAWHRGWKSRFPEATREKVHFDKETGEKHVADLKTATGLFIELQHSSISATELRSREQFYTRMMWIVDSEPFKSNFQILGKLPRPTGKLSTDVVFQTDRIFWRKSENPRHEDPRSLQRIHSTMDIVEEIEREYVGHHFFKWRWPRSVWYAAEQPVFFDFGDEFLWRLKRYYSDKSLYSVRRVSKKDLIRKNGGT